LYLDFYEAKNNNAAYRPLVICVHGGGFVSGHKTQDNWPKICSTFAKKGYVAASFNYRMGSNSGEVFEFLFVISPKCYFFPSSIMQILPTRMAILVTIEFIQKGKKNILVFVILQCQEDFCNNCITFLLDCKSSLSCFGIGVKVKSWTLMMETSTERH
jgi:hypothetical protein